jgi:histone-binding protein RBBP4
MVITHELEWPSLTVSWMPEKSINTEYSLQKLVLGTHTDNTETNYLMIAKVRIPTEETLKEDLKD